MSGFSLNIPISKVDEEQRIVYGYATKEELDRQGDIVDYEAAKKAFSDWPGNIREQHDAKKAVGKNTLLEFDDDQKRILIGAYVSKSTDGENAWTKVQEGILTGFSIGGKIFKTIRETVKADDGSTVAANRITDFSLSEVSLVDVPACPSAQFVMVKSLDGKLEQVEEMHQSSDAAPLPWFMKSFTYSIEQVNQLEKAHHNKVEKQSKENAMADAKDEKLEKVNVHAGEERDAAAEVVEDKKDEETTEKAVAVHGGDARDANAEEVTPEVGGKTEEEAAEQVEEQKPDEAPVKAEPLAVKPEKTTNEEKSVDADMKKGLYNVADLADCVSNLSWIVSDAEWEATYSGKGEAAAQLKAAVSQVADALLALTAEAVEDLKDDETVELADRPADLVKMVDEKLDARQNDMLKAFGDMVAGKVEEIVKPLTDRIKSLESQPAGKAPQRYAVVDKVADAPSEASEYENLVKQADALPATASVSERSALAQKLMIAKSRMRPVTINE